MDVPHVSQYTVFLMRACKVLRVTTIVSIGLQCYKMKELCFYIDSYLRVHYHLHVYL